jgi:hypothetical protein
MKRNGDIMVLFQQAAAKAVKKAAATASPSPVVTSVQEEAQEQHRGTEEIVNSSPVQSFANEDEDVLPTPPVPPVSLPVYDISCLPYDPGERVPIASYRVNDQDAIRRAYILKGPFKPIGHQFPKRTIGNRNRSRNLVWLYTIIGLNTVSRRMLSFAFHATCSKTHKTR